MISIDYQSRIPIYKQIENEIERYVSLGILKPNEQIFSIRELATNLGINPNTVKKAYTELERKGVINTISTKGTFITANIDIVIKEKVDEKINKIKLEIEELKKLNLTYEEIIKRIEGC